MKLEPDDDFPPAMVEAVEETALEGKIFLARLNSTNIERVGDKGLHETRTSNSKRIETAIKEVQGRISNPFHGIRESKEM